MPRKLLIVGGGLTGLSAALMAAQAGTQVTVLEASPFLGGLLQTFEIAGGRAEYFYHHHFKDDLEFKWLLRELKIEDKLKFYPTSMGFYREGQLYPFNGLGDLLKFRPVSFIDKLRFAWSTFFLAKICHWRACENIRAREWFEKNSGHTASESIWTPMLKIKFGDNAGRLPLSWMAGRLRQRLNSRRAGQETLGYLDGSLHTLLVALEEKLRALGVELITSAKAEEIIYENNRAVGVRTKTNTLRADEILFTTPTPILANLVKPIDTAYAAQLKRIEYFGALCVVIETSRALSDIYWTNVADADFPFGGVIEHTNLVSPQTLGGRHVTYLSRYFELTNPLAQRPDADVIQEFLSALKRIYPTLKDSEILKTHCFRSMSAAPVNDLNFSKILPRYNSPIAGLYVASMPQLYPDERSCNNCVRLAAGALARMGYNTSAVPQGPTLAGVFA